MNQPAECCDKFPPWAVQHLHFGEYRISVVDLGKAPGEWDRGEYQFEVILFGPDEEDDYTYRSEHRFKTQTEALVWADQLLQLLLSTPSPSALADFNPVDQ